MLTAITLEAKLQIKPEDKVFLVNPPKSAPAPQNPARVVDLADTVVLYAVKAAHLDLLVAPVILGLAPEARLWICFPKPGKFKSDLGRDTIWIAMKAKGLEGMQVVSVDETWSAFAFKRAA
jgi:hypothetical protein